MGDHLGYQLLLYLTSILIFLVYFKHEIKLTMEQHVTWVTDSNVL